MRRPFSLSPRLQAIADMVPHGARLADVGTDHGQLPVWLIQHGVIDHAVASDLRLAPLNRARDLAARWGVSAQIDFRLCDGLTLVSPHEAEVVTIAGMGGETIADILHAARWPEQETGHCYILQAMSGMDGLRRYLSNYGYAIQREQLIAEGDTFYVVLLAEKDDTSIPLTEGEIWVGRHSSYLEESFRNKYLEQELNKLYRAIIGLGKSQRPEDTEKQKQYELAAYEVEQMKKEWEQWRP